MGAITPVIPPSSTWTVKSVAFRRIPPTVKTRLPVGLIERWTNRGLALGATYEMFVSGVDGRRDIGRINDRLDSIQQQMTPTTPATDAKPAISGPVKGHHGHSAIPTPAP